MGFELPKFNLQEFIKDVENAVQQLDNHGESQVGDGVDSFEKASLFNNPKLADLKQKLTNALSSGDADAEEIKNTFGLQLSGTGALEEVEESNSASSRRRANGTGSGDNGEQPVVNITVEAGGTMNVVIDNSSNWQLTINVTADLKKMVQQLIDTFKSGFESINANNNQLFEQLKAYLGEQATNIFSLLYAMYDAIRNDGDLQIEVLKAILGAIENNGVKIEETNGLLKALNEMLADKLDNIAIMIGKADQNAQANMNKLVELVIANNDKQDEQNKVLSYILDAVKSLNGSVKTLSDQQRTQLAAILDLMNAQGNELDANFQKVLAMLEAIRLAQGDNNDVLNNIYGAIKEGNTNLLDALAYINNKFSQYGDDIKALLIRIAEKECPGGGSVDITELLKKLDTIIEKLTNIDQNTDNTAKYSKQILDAVNKLGINITTSLDTIIAAMGNDTGKLDKLIELLGKLDAHNTEQNQAILEAISGLGDGISGIIDALNNLNIDVEVDLNPVIDAIKTCGSNIITKLEKLFSTLSAVNDNVIAGNTNNENFVKLILNAIKNSDPNPGSTLSLDNVMIILEQILAAIKDVNVNVKVIIDKMGNVHCGTNEGENNDWTNVLNAKAVSPLDDWGEDDATGISSAKTDSKNGPIYDLSGRKVTGDLTPGHIYIQNGKKFVAQ